MINCPLYLICSNFYHFSLSFYYIEFMFLLNYKEIYSVVELFPSSLHPWSFYMLPPSLLPSFQQFLCCFLGFCSGFRGFLDIQFIVLQIEWLLDSSNIICVLQTAGYCGKRGKAEEKKKKGEETFSLCENTWDLLSLLKHSEISGQSSPGSSRTLTSVRRSQNHF